MTTPEDVKPDTAPPAGIQKKPVAKKTAASAASAIVASAAQKASASAKPVAKKTAKPTTNDAVGTDKPTPKKAAQPKAPTKVAAKAKAEMSAVEQPKTATKPATKTKTKAPAVEAKPSVSKPAPQIVTPVVIESIVAADIPHIEPLTPSEPSVVTEKSGAPDWANAHATKIIQRAAAKSSGKNHKLHHLRQKAVNYLHLARMDRPIGTLLLLWPTLWALWIAAKGVPSIKNLVIFVLGVIVMRAAGCVINDFADRKIDGKVLRTKNRPLATGAVSSREAIGLFVTLCLIAFTLVLFTDPLTIKLSVGGLLLAVCYPFMKRHTHLPQVVLGAAFAWGIPMAYAAEAGELNQHMWLIYLAVVLWTVAYDTFYAMVDRDDDLKIGVKSTAILFGEQDRVITGILQFLTLYTLFLVGKRFELGTAFYLGLVAAAGLFIYQQWLIRFRVREACFKAFLNNNWVGVAIFVGIAVDFALKQV